MMPLKDYNPTRRTPIITVGLIIICCYIYFFVQPRDQVDDVAGADPSTSVASEELRWVASNAAIPCEVVRGRPLTQREFVETASGDPSACRSRPDTPSQFPKKNVYLAILFSMFLHGSLLHLGGNMLYLWVFGNNIEDTRGKAQYIVFYLLAGVAATFTHIAADLNSTVPMIGASGAIAGVMGAYLVLFPNVRIRSLIFFGIILFRDITAKWLLGVWFVMQFFTSPNSGVAWLAHVGGFVFGMLAGVLWRTQARRPPARPVYTG